MRRDRVAIVTFRRRDAELVLEPSRSISRALATLDALPVGGTTPLCCGLEKTLRILKSWQKTGGEQKTVLLFTDGRGNVPLNGTTNLARKERSDLIAKELEILSAQFRALKVHMIVVDTMPLHLSTGDAESVARRLDATLARLNDMHEFDIKPAIVPFT